jgi:hypothetical protein
MRGRLTEGHLHLQRHRQRQVLLKASKPPELPVAATSIKHPSNADYVHEQDLLLVTDAGPVTVIIRLAISLILIVIGSVFKQKIQL